MQPIPTLLNSCARAATAAEARYRIDEMPLSPRSVRVLALDERGALFFSDICAATGRMPVEVADALWDGIARGLVTADDFQAVRSLLRGRSRLGHLVGPLRPASGVDALS